MYSSPPSKSVLQTSTVPVMNTLKEKIEKARVLREKG